MFKKWCVQYSDKLFAGFFYTVIFIFFGFFYNYHLHYLEQTQLFLYNIDNFLEKISLPGGLAGYVGGFLIQFYSYSLAGPLIITLLIFGIQQLSRQIFSAVNGNVSFFPISFFPALFAAIMLCDEYYPLSALVGALIALQLGCIYLVIKGRRYRFITGIFIIPFTYWMAGGAYMMLLSVIFVFEIFVVGRLKKRNAKNSISESDDTGRLSPLHLFMYILMAFGVPLLVKSFLILQPFMLTFFSEFYYELPTVLPKTILFFFALPAILMVVILFLPVMERRYNIALIIQFGLLIIIGYSGCRFFTDFNAEEIYTYDYLVRKEQWEEVIKFAEKRPPRNDLSLAMLNLSLAKTGKMGDKLFNFQQNGSNGLFLPLAHDYFALIIRSDIFYQLGIINASQESAFESMETTPNLNKSVRSIKRLTETNLINGHYEVAKKYLRILEKTTCYRKWAVETGKYLHNEEMISADPYWGSKRDMMIRTETFFKAQNVESTLNMLNMLLSENPQNRMALEYLVAYYLLNKDLLGFLNCLPMIEKSNYSKLPVSYQEAILYLTGIIPKDPESDLFQKVSDYTKSKMRAYTTGFISQKDPREFLMNKFSGTYWYYFDFKAINLESGK